MTITHQQIDPSRYVFTPGVTPVSDVDLDQQVYHDAVSGERVTEKTIKSEASAVEARSRGLVPGGKSLSGSGIHSPRIQLVVPAETRDEITRRAAADHMSVSRWLRRVVERELAA